MVMEIMKRIMIMVLVAMACVALTGCRSHYAASSESAYQERINAMKAEMANDGYTLASQGVTNGYHDKETYSFSNDAGETVQFSYDVHRGEHNGNIFIDEVNPAGCSTSNAQTYNKYCGNDGVQGTVTTNNLKKDVKGSKFSVGKTILASLGGAFVVGILLGLLEAAAMGLL